MERKEVEVQQERKGNVGGKKRMKQFRMKKGDSNDRRGRLAKRRR